MKKYYYTEQEINDFKKFMKITRKWPQEQYLKLLDRWRNYASCKDMLLKECLDYIIQQSSLATDKQYIYLINKLKKEINKKML